jgi:hypothetical protein
MDKAMLTAGFPVPDAVSSTISPGRMAAAAMIIWLKLSSGDFPAAALATQDSLRCCHAFRPISDIVVSYDHRRA